MILLPFLIDHHIKGVHQDQGKPITLPYYIYSDNKPDAHIISTINKPIIAYWL